MKKRKRSLFDFMDQQYKLGYYKDPLKILDEHIDCEGFREMWGRRSLDEREKELPSRGCRKGAFLAYVA